MSSYTRAIELDAKMLRKRITPANKALITVCIRYDALTDRVYKNHFSDEMISGLVDDAPKNLQ